MKKFSIVVAATSISSGIGKQGKLAWKLSGDMNYFKTITSTTNSQTKKNAVIMGRKTYESIPSKFRPLDSRLNVILSRNPRIREELSLPPAVLIASSLPHALELLSSADMESVVDKIFVIGGSSVYAEALTLSSCQSIYLTRIAKEFPDLDAFFPTISAEKFKLVSKSLPVQENDISYQYLIFEAFGDDEVLPSAGGSVVTSANPCSNPIDQNEVTVNVTASISSDFNTTNPEEQQYLDIVRDILASGVRRGDRTGTGTISKFGVQMRFSLRNGVFPLLTTKKVFWRGVAEELLWFIKGSTNAKELSDKGVKIWDGNGSKEFLVKCGLGHREEGDLGPVYGFQVGLLFIPSFCLFIYLFFCLHVLCSWAFFVLILLLSFSYLQWRHFGAEYTDMHANYDSQGIDQLQDCIHKIKHNPEDRRIIMTAWNPADLSKMALPPCHMFCQFYVANGELSCQVNTNGVGIMSCGTLVLLWALQ